MSSLANSTAFSSWGTFLVLLLGTVFFLYLSRDAAHQVLRNVFAAIYSSLRLGAVALNQSRTKLQQRNREVLLNLGREQTERELEKEFYEINKFVQKDLGGYSQLQRQMNEQITRIQDDYDRSKEVPPVSPDWVEAVDAIANIKSNKQTPDLNNKILEQIHQSAEQHHKEILQTQREEAKTRHSVLKSMTPFWRKLAYSVDEVGSRLNEIIKRSQSIDNHMAKYNEIVSGSEKAERSLKASAMTQFLIALIVIIIAAGGAFFNFHLIALPMSEMVGSVHRVAGVKVADLAALVIICLEVTAGIFLLESLRITKLFPLIHSMDDRARKIILISSCTVLLVLAGTESALAFMRDQIAGDLAALRSSLSGVEQTQLPGGHINEWIPLAANMILGFILPLALTMVAIPLEYLLQTSRTIIGALIESLLGLFAVILRCLATLAKNVGRVLIGFYDILIALPLWIEAMAKNIQKSKNKTASSPYSDSHEVLSASLPQYGEVQK